MYFAANHLAHLGGNRAGEGGDNGEGKVNVLEIGRETVEGKIREVRKDEEKDGESGKIGRVSEGEKIKEVNQEEGKRKEERGHEKRKL